MRRTPSRPNTHCFSFSFFPLKLLCASMPEDFKQLLVVETWFEIEDDLCIHGLQSHPSWSDHCIFLVEIMCFLIPSFKQIILEFWSKLMHRVLLWRVSCSSVLTQDSWVLLQCQLLQPVWAFRVEPQAWLLATTTVLSAPKQTKVRGVVLRLTASSAQKPEKRRGVLVSTQTFLAVGTSIGSPGVLQR